MDVTFTDYQFEQESMDNDEERSSPVKQAEEAEPLPT
jgi:hypothetical protein